ncbi:MAG: hypothetical protein LC687_03415 [Actinobacteria bacterium]|nr:hypothetical protein [Actinomycetota bacterium]
MTEKKRTKSCDRCGLEFTYERSTAKYCSDTCRRYVNLKAQRKKDKRNASRRTLRALRRRWNALEGRRASREWERYDLMCDLEGGDSFAQEKLDQIERDLARFRPYWDRDERTLRREAEKNGFKWEQITQETGKREA